MTISGGMKGRLFLNGLSRESKSDDMRRLRRYFLQWAGIENIDAIDANRRRKDFYEKRANPL